MTATEHADVVIIGSGMGGGTLAWALRDLGARVLLLERGDFLPVEAQNWSPEAVFIENRYKAKEQWRDRHGHWFSPGGLLPPSSAPRRYEMDVDWVLHQAERQLSPRQVRAQVQQLRRQGLARHDSLAAPEPALSSPCNL